MIDLKIVEEREIDGLIYQRVRIYQGAVTTEDEPVGLGDVLQPVTRYRRTGLVEEREYWYG